MIAVQPKSRQILGINQQAYQSLRSALSLHLRRQLFIAVCDSVVLQERLATQLEDDIIFNSRGSFDHFGLDDFDLDAEMKATGTGANAVLDRLVFEPEDAHLPRQVVRWMLQSGHNRGPMSQLQVLGLGQMTRQPAIVQNHFLRSLEKIDALLPRLNTSLLVWVSWPWLRTIQQSAPNFWQWRNGLYEFVGDPTPTPVNLSYLLSDSDAVTESQTVADNLAATLNGEVARLSVRLHGEADDWESLEADTVVDLEAESTVAPITINARETAPEAVIPDSDSVDATDAKNAQLQVNTAVVDSVLEDFGIEKPVPEEPVPEEPVPEEFVLEESSPEEPVLKKSFSEEPFLEDSFLEESFLEESFLEEALLEDSFLSESLLEEPVLEDSVLEKPAFEESVLEESVLEAPISKVANLPPPNESELASWEKAANDYFAVGYQHRSLIEAGDRTPDAIEPAIAAYEAGLRCIEGPYPNLGSCLNDLGTLYWLRAQQLGEPQQIADCMIHSIKLYSQALEQLDPQQNSAMVCQLYSNMGAVYSLLAAYLEPAPCFQQAVIVYSQAVTISAKTAPPQEQSMLCNSLGSVYWKLSHYEQTEQNLRLAIEAYQQALSGYDPVPQPLDYAAVQNNLGITYWSLAKHESSIEAYEKAIAAYKEALIYRTAETDPAACAITYNNLALAYWDLSKDSAVEQSQKASCQQNAVTAFESALETAEGVDALSDMDSAAVYHCLGDVYMQMIDITASTEEIAQMLQKSLQSYIHSVDGLTDESPLFQPRLSAIVANLQFQYEYIGLSSQRTGLNQIPPWLIPYVMPIL
ncbi:MAG: tetratricopeptide repeat protein [Phormidesmis sp.]